jgi:hydrogenase maturation protein HypF
MMERRGIVVQGIVQGVGFRPFVYELANRLGLQGFVQNQVGEVWIEIEGDPVLLARFLEEVVAKAPPLARIEHLHWTLLPLRQEDNFRIEPSTQQASGTIFVPADTATCPGCLRELFDPMDRRYRYPFLNCTQCGPRLTIITGWPYDRERTTMASFPMCEACRAEFADPSNRRFHAQPIACPACGPRLQLLNPQGQPLQAADPLRVFVAAIRGGQIGALKGLGGYHLVCDARNEKVVAALRRRKQRDEKPLAIMVADVAAAALLCEITPAEKELLQSSRRPIVLLRKRPGTSIAQAVAPRNPYLGIMLPYTPLHHLLMHDVAGLPLVMTSGNRADEPIAYQEEDACFRLQDIADLFLVHDRPIHVRCDDSVTRCLGGQEAPVRRSRGYAPQSLPLPITCPRPTLAVGGQFKATFALGRDRHAFLSHHLGDLDHLDAYQAFTRDLLLYQELFALEPQLLVHDLHPEYASTRYARELGEKLSIPLLAVQHHHAHLASCLAENMLDEPVIGVTLDGSGYGTDGTIWGGEFLVGNYRQVRRAAHLRPVGLPGGDQAVREPWRVALSYLRDAGADQRSLQGRIAPAALRAVNLILDRGLNTPRTSSAGRLFDAVAVLAGVRDHVSFEGQAAMELEWLATEVVPDGEYPFELSLDQVPWQIDTRPLIQAVVQDAARGVAAGTIGRRFHSTLVTIIHAVCDKLRTTTGLGALVLGGGVFMNVLLTREVRARLQEGGFRVYDHHWVPANDGGLSLGQLAIAAAWSPGQQVP